jgi:DNA-directed RNA polymerase specialized sigma subunit
MTGKEYLKQLKKIDTQLKNKAFELKQLKELGLSLGQTLEDTTKLEVERAKIIKTIERLPEAEYDVLHKVYVQGETLQEVAADRNISYSLVATIHGRGLKRLENIINA